VILILASKCWRRSPDRQAAAACDSSDTLYPAFNLRKCWFFVNTKSSTTHYYCLTLFLLR